MNFAKLCRTFVSNPSKSQCQKLIIRVAYNDSPSGKNLNASSFSKLIHTNSSFFDKKIFEEENVDNAAVKAEENGQSSDITSNNSSMINKSQKHLETNHKKKKDSFLVSVVMTVN